MGGNQKMILCETWEEAGGLDRECHVWALGGGEVAHGAVHDCEELGGRIQGC